jgi:hypothetical protein
MALWKSKRRTSTIMPHARTGVYAFLLIALSSGCSMVFTRPARDASGKPLDDAPPCTVSEWIPLLDVAGVVAGGIALGLGVSDHDSVFTTVGAGSMALYTASAGYGFVSAAQCDAPAAQRSRTTTPAQSPNGAPGPRNLGSEVSGSTSLGSASSPNVSYSLSSRF